MPSGPGVFSVGKFPNIITTISLELPIGEGNGTPLQCSRLENPRDGGVCRLWGRTESDTTEAT